MAKSPFVVVVIVVTIVVDDDLLNMEGCSNLRK